MSKIRFDVTSENNVIPHQGLAHQVDIGMDEAIWVFGAYLGFFDGEKTAGPRSLQVFLNEAQKPGQLPKMVQYAIGRLVIVHQKANSVDVFVSSGAPGLFMRDHEGRYRFSEDETEINRLDSKSDLNDFEVLQLVLSHNGMRSPFRTIFEDVRRLPSASHFSTESPDQINIHMGVFPDDNAPDPWRTDEAGMTEYASRLEGIMGAVSEANETKSTILQASGGIDSSCLLTAARRVGASTTAITFGMGAVVPEMIAGKICKRMGFDHHYLYEPLPARYNDAERAMEDMMLEQFVGVPIVGSDIEKRNFMKAQGLEDSIIIHGQNSDSLYSIEGFRPDYAKVPNSVYNKGLEKSVEQRRIFTGGALSKLIEGERSRLSEGTSARRLYDYFITMVCSIEEHLEPFKSSLALPRELAPIGQAFANYKVASVVEPVVGKSADFESDIRNGLTANQFNRRIRRLKFARFAQSATYQVHHRSMAAGAGSASMIFSEGPLLQYFSNYMLDETEAQFPKRMLFSYFSQVYGENYFSVKNEILAEHLAKTIRLPQGYAERVSERLSLEKQGNADFHGVERLQRFKEDLDPQKSILLQTVKHDATREFLKARFALLHEGGKQLGNRHVFRQMLRIVGLERHLRMLG